MTSTLSRATIPIYILNFFLWGPSALPVVGSTWTTGLSTLGGLVDKYRRREALRVCFSADGKADASEGGEGGEGGGGEAGGEALILYTITLIFCKISVILAKKQHRFFIFLKIDVAKKKTTSMLSFAKITSIFKQHMLILIL